MLPQGRSQDLVGPRMFYARVGNLAKPCTLLGGFGGMPPDNFLIGAI